MHNREVQKDAQQESSWPHDSISRKKDAKKKEKDKKESNVNQASTETDPQYIRMRTF